MRAKHRQSMTQLAAIGHNLLINYSSKFLEFATISFFLLGEDVSEIRRRIFGLEGRRTLELRCGIGKVRFRFTKNVFLCYFFNCTAKKKSFTKLHTCFQLCAFCIKLNSSVIITDLEGNSFADKTLCTNAHKNYG